MQILVYWSFLLLLYAPTFVANAIPVVIKNIPIVKNYTTPINEKYFWKNKTYRGFIGWVLWAIAISILEYSIIRYMWENPISQQYYAVIHSFSLALLAGVLQGFWALWGDLLESFVKRSIGKKPGEPWVFWDGADYIIGSIVLFSVVYIPTLWWIAFLILFSPCISLIANTTAYIIGWKDVWY